MGDRHPKGRAGLDGMANIKARDIATRRLRDEESRLTSAGSKSGGLTQRHPLSV